MCSLRILPCLAVLSAICLAPGLKAQVSSVAPRVAGPVDENSLAALKGNLSNLARPQFDQGQADPSTVIPYVRVLLSRSPQQEAALEQFMAQQLDKNSPNYHRWLTPEQFGSLYGPADSDIAAVVAWLQSHGLKIETVPAGKTDIAFTGTVGQIEEALHTSIHTFQVNGHQFYSNTSAPKIPSALAPVIVGFARLNTLEPRAHYVPAKSGRYDSQARKFLPTDASPSLARPDLTTGSSFLWTVPADAATIYDTPNSYNAAFSTGTSYTGTGVTIGIGGDGAIQPSTVVDFRTLFLNGDTTPPTITDAGISQGAAQANSDTDEAYLDNEVAGGLAPGATIHFYVADRTTSGGITTAVEQMINDNNVDIISLSFGACELDLPTVDNQLIDGWWQQAATDGIAVVVSTGDSGSAGCDSQDTETVAADGLQVSGFATTPYNIAVGGTDFHGLLNGGFSTYVNNNQTSSNSWRSALGYIPESTWNDSTSNNGQISGNVPYVNSQTSATDIVGGAGGASSCSTNTTTIDQTTGKPVPGACTNGYAKPTWQRGAGVPADGVRDVPDVSLLAANGFDGATWLVCTDDTEQNSNSQTVTENCTTQPDNNFYWAGIGGTSASTPAFAGILALVTQKAGGRIGLDGAKFLYDIYNGAQSGAVFHDITTGNNSVICTQGTPNCNAVGASFFLSGYNTTQGYDLATGLGSVDATHLVNAYATSTGSGVATVSATPTPSAIDSSQAVSVAVTVSGSGSLGTPTGTVTLTGGGYTSSAEPLAAGGYTFNIPGNSLSAGNDSLTIAYSGDSNYASATGSTSVTVNPGPAKLTPTVTVTPASNSIDTGQPLNVTVTVAGGSGNPIPTQTVTLTASSYSSSPTSLDSNGNAAFTIPANTFASSGNANISASYIGDNNYNSASGQATITLTQSTFSLAASAPSAISPGSSATSTVTVTSTTGYAGSVNLNCQVTNSPSNTNDMPNCSVTAGSPVTLSASAASGTATVTVTTTAASAASLDRRGLPGWTGPAGGAVLALLVFFGIPARRRCWRNMLGLLVLILALGSLSACNMGGNGGGGGGGGGGSTSGTTAGQYTITVSGNGNPSAGSAVTTTFTLTVN